MRQKTGGNMSNNPQIVKPITTAKLNLEPHPEERKMIKGLLLTNPNYFGNLAASKQKAVVSIVANTYYEEICSVGYQSQQKYLEAVIYLYQPNGYMSDLCGPGSTEYVRFYVSFDKGTNWVDQGMTSFQAYDIPGVDTKKNKLEYAVSLQIKPPVKGCKANLLFQVRAILSWNNPIPANMPNWKPIWGNVCEKTILQEPVRFLKVKEIYELTKVKPTLLQEMVPGETEIPVTPKDYSPTELAVLYKAEKVPVQRYAYKELAKVLSVKTKLTAKALSELMPGMVINKELLSQITLVKDGDTSYEELLCIGLDPNFPDTMVGILQQKKKCGYSGDPCSTGSKEYVTFWADFDGNGSFETCLGIASVTVYDVDIPAGGVFYAVRIPVNLTEYRQACKKGPKEVRIRAILSWNAPVPATDPNKVPVWGNREESQILIAPSAAAPAGQIAILGGVPVSMIDSASGLTTATAVFATNNLPVDNPDGDLSTYDARPCPFAGRVTVQGVPLVGYSYKVEVTPSAGGAPMTVVTNLVLTRQDGSTYTHKADPTTLRFTFVPFTENINSVLAQWDSAGNELWDVKLTTYNSSGVPMGSDVHKIQLDNTWPEAAIQITSGTGNCGKFKIGDMISGTYVARDDYLNIYTLVITPPINPGLDIPTPSSGLVNTPVSPGSTWSLNTGAMVDCGYVINLTVVDRAIWNSQSGGHHNYAYAGFCLEKKK